MQHFIGTFQTYHYKRIVLDYLISFFKHNNAFHAHLSQGRTSHGRGEWPMAGQPSNWYSWRAGIRTWQSHFWRKSVKEDSSSPIHPPMPSTPKERSNFGSAALLPFWAPGMHKNEISAPAAASVGRSTESMNESIRMNEWIDSLRDRAGGAGGGSRKF